LAAIGFKPILIPSPVQGDKHTGGGHFISITTENVDGYSHEQTLYQYTGDLLVGIKDMWPGGGINMRLPGGKYVKHGFAAWCDMYDADGTQLTHDGVGAARVLLDYQTPIDCINQYE